MIAKLIALEKKWKHESPLNKYTKYQHILNKRGSGKPYLVEWTFSCVVDAVNSNQMHPSVFSIPNISPKAGGKGVVHLFLARRNIKEWWFSFLDKHAFNPWAVEKVKLCMANHDSFHATLRHLGGTEMEGDW